jgi:hypothetical protein
MKSGGGGKRHEEAEYADSNYGEGDALGRGPQKRQKHSWKKL